MSNTPTARAADGDLIAALREVASELEATADNVSPIHNLYPVDVIRKSAKAIRATLARAEAGCGAGWRPAFSINGMQFVGSGFEIHEDGSLHIGGVLQEADPGNPVTLSGRPIKVQIQFLPAPPVAANQEQSHA